jgi:C4-dicarboxylate-specific signal transduction histidine kinase
VFLAVVQPVHVQVANESSLLGPILVATGAVLAAGLTVFTANWRQAKQLRHDRELHRQQLDHDPELRHADLMYDRQMRHRARSQEVLVT